MSERTALRSHVTLAMTTLLHLLTHAYGVVLVPLYLLMRDDLHLAGVSAAAKVVTVYGVTYSLFSYPAGMLADRYDRKLLLSLGTLGNALAIGLMGLTHSYPVLLALGCVGGLFGTLFHPTANALIPAHYPKRPGTAIGLLAMGTGLGFYIGPRFSGWRAEAAAWHLWTVSPWQKPLVEFGAAGVIVALLYFLLASEADGRARNGPRVRPPLGPVLRRRMLIVAATLGCRDFAGVASITLVSLYLQRACGMDVKQTGRIIGTLFLLSVPVNPVLVYLSPRGRRLPAYAALVLLGGAVFAAVPFAAASRVVPILCLFQACHLGSYAVSDAAMLERVPDALRGRVVGLFLLIAGTAGGLSPWCMGFCVDRLGDHAGQAAAYAPIFAAVGALMAVGVSAAPALARLGDVQGHAIEPITEAMPATVEVVG